MKVGIFPGNFRYLVSGGYYRILEMTRLTLGMVARPERAWPSDRFQGLLRTRSLAHGSTTPTFQKPVPPFLPLGSDSRGIAVELGKALSFYGGRSWVLAGTEGSTQLSVGTARIRLLRYAFSGRIQSSCILLGESSDTV